MVPWLVRDNRDGEECISAQAVLPFSPDSTVTVIKHTGPRAGESARYELYEGRIWGPLRFATWVALASISAALLQTLVMAAYSVLLG